MTNRCLELASRATPLASCIAALLGLSVDHEAFAATTHLVTSCADHGAGTLRSIVLDTVGTVSGDTIDFSNVAPCTISLNTGAIDITQGALTIQAPAGKYMIDEKGNVVGPNGELLGTLPAVLKPESDPFKP